MDSFIELDEEEKAFISDVFFEKMAPKLKKLNARIGAIPCDFAGNKYKNWLIHFRSSGNGFEVVDFEYDPDARPIDYPI
ncbi:MAG: hypothetical protein JRH08_02895 [Deltaproteobacteria bacterium]|nr:hypothetical protein [Deltaproteobacteria bacterium]MBW1928202.1 hypothetical protein [Deltaproteobacteria bacterium]MBW2024351.1 hypothetical protein [Deltaproteobacteria bacterium]MBW2124648.1 hypothetical protein [Deltaproteobacteria bacterium]RLB15240.1 MAG: hypothetical protein DRG63_07200 [Deltaproteobacteria bacterium]